MDINDIDILKIYKIASPNPSSDELEREASYIAILKTKGYIKSLFNYQGKKGSDTDSEKVVLCREFFSVIKTSKDITAKDISFFYQYYYDQKKYKTAIDALLIKEFGVSKSEVEKVYKPNQKENLIGEGQTLQKEEEKNFLCVTRCDKETLTRLKKCQDILASEKWTEKVKSKYPETSKQTLYSFLDIGRFKSAEEFKLYISSKRTASDNLAMDSHDFDSLVDIYNCMETVTKFRDFEQNFESYKIIIRFLKLSPFLYEIDEITKKALSSLYSYANSNYEFQDLQDFLITFFLSVYENFGIDTHGIKSELKKLDAEKYKRKTVAFIDKLIGRDKEDYLPIWKQIIFMLCYLPFMLLFAVYELVKAVAFHIRYIAFVIVRILILDLTALFWSVMTINKAVHFFTIEGIYLTKYAYQNFLYYAELIRQEFEILSLNASAQAIFEIIIAILLIILAEVIIVFVPSILIGRCMWNAAASLRKAYDWTGTERTLFKIYDLLKHNFKAKGKKGEQRTAHLIKALLLMILNLFIVISICYGCNKLDIKFLEKPFQVEEIQLEETTAEAETETETPDEPEIQYTVFVSAANIRSGPGTNHDTVLSAVQGQVFDGTGMTSQADGGSVWYEIYLDAEHTKTGWASSKVIEPDQ